MQCLTYNKTYRLLEDGEADDGVGLCLPDHVPELLYAVVAEGRVHLILLSY